ncbi:MAG TPA: glycoside hydrolase domain-containing protein, partial [Armatimonadota bacterium]|nr:glycoside hydrolase domain-containing protein [Armatimonadota bacterium]
FSDGATPLYGNLHTAPLDVMDTLGAFVKQYHELGTRLLPYLYLHGVSAGATGCDRYYPVWQTSSPRQIGGGDRVIMGACPGSSFGDYLLYGIGQWVDKYGVDGVYFDGAGPPVECANPLHDHGWVDADGARHIEYPIFGLRSFYRRLWTMLADRMAQPVIWTHADGKMPTPCFAFTTANWVGEMVQGPLRAGDAFLSDLLPLDWWRAYMLATQWGPVPMWLVTTSRTDLEMQPRQERDTLALLLVHGIPFARRGQINSDLLDKVWSAQAQFDIGAADFHGYWQNADLVQLTPPDDRIVASLYQRDGHVMLIISNLTEHDAQVNVALAEGVRPAGAMTDCISAENVPVTAGALSLTVQAKSFRMLTG